MAIALPSLVQSALILAAFVLVHLLFRARKTQPKAGRLPSPKGLPVIGSVADLPLNGGWFKWYEWAQQLGPLYEINLAGDKIIIASSNEIVSELYNGRGGKYADRPPLFGLEDSRGTLTSQAGYLPFMGAGTRHQNLRKAANRFLTDDRSQQHYGYPTLEARRLIYRLSTSQASKRDWLSMVCDSVDRVAARLAWGSPDPAVRHRELTEGLLHAASVSTNIANAISVLHKIPYAISPWKRAEKVRRDEQTAWWLDQLKIVEKRMDDGVAGPSWAANLLEALRAPESKIGMDRSTTREDLAALTGIIASMASFANSSLVRNAIKMMVAHPDWAKRVRAELDAVVGTERLPEVSDVPHLPTLRAFLRETMRVHVPVPTGVPHAVQGEDDVYRGFVIPHGQPIFACDYILCRDPVTYPDPFSFNPDRWLSADFPTTFQPDLTQYPTLIGASAFGTGRRVCLGQHLVATKAYMLFAHVAWAFDLSTPDPQAAFGTHLGPHEKWGGMQVPQTPEGSVLVLPTVPCDMDFKLRSPQHEKVIADAYAASKETDPLRALGAVNVE
ncbi:hypothetical protein OC834_003358 [Tilletia horrida]|nr:hypothetical protein OC834_003358 [Tilletia horrida]KAK0531020.1 hypothetical protein OC835_003819 [Tilletia horrida]KAK0565718.1 hypothetical protein OC844_001086 [Tilletia horrida]